MHQSVLLEQAAAVAPVIAGAVVAAAMQAREPSQKTAFQKATDFCLDTLIGASSAYFLAGFTVEFFNQTSPKAQMAIGFILGAIGVQIVRWFIKDGFNWLKNKVGVQ